MKTSVFFFALILSLNGCAIAPGMKMDDTPAMPNVEIIPITADLVYQQELHKRHNMNESLAVERQQEIQNYQYRVGPRDILTITVWDHPELTIPAGEFRSAEVAGHLVAEDGTIFYPYVGTVHVAGKTLAEIREFLTRSIARTIANPQLDIRVAAFRSQKAYVVGEVQTPGPQPITDVPLTIVEAVNGAGGVTADSDMVNVTLSRDGLTSDVNLQAIYEQGEISEDLLLRDGDILNVPDRNRQKVFVIGEVASPSSYLMNKGRKTLAEAISDAGGVDRISSNPARIYVIRGTPEKAEIYHLNSKSPEALVLGEQFDLMPRDVVYVETAGVARWNRVIEQLVPTTELLRNLAEIESKSFD